MPPIFYIPRYIPLETLYTIPILVLIFYLCIYFKILVSTHVTDSHQVGHIKHSYERVQNLGASIFFFFFWMHHNRPDLTSSSHPQVKLIGRRLGKDPVQCFTARPMHLFGSTTIDYQSCHAPLVIIHGM